LALGLEQARVANMLETVKDTVYLWENNRVKPTFPFLPKIIEFLGFCPIDPEDTPGRRLAWARQCNGISQKNLAHLTGMDQSTLWKLEKGRWLGRELFLERVREYLEEAAELGFLFLS
jgi:transcriptional regulator with XRE-family HTH domain